MGWFDSTTNDWTDLQLLDGSADEIPLEKRHDDSDTTMVFSIAAHILSGQTHGVFFHRFK